MVGSIDIAVYTIAQEDDWCEKHSGGGHHCSVSIIRCPCCWRGMCFGVYAGVYLSACVVVADYNLHHPVHPHLFPTHRPPARLQQLLQHVYGHS